VATRRKGPVRADRPDPPTAAYRHAVSPRRRRNKRLAISRSAGARKIHLSVTSPARSSLVRRRTARHNNQVRRHNNRVGRHNNRVGRHMRSRVSPVRRLRIRTNRPPPLG
jgi:hypothetical protein